VKLFEVRGDPIQLIFLYTFAGRRPRAAGAGQQYAQKHHFCFTHNFPIIILDTKSQPRMIPDTSRDWQALVWLKV
jgi:hypothetical protein